MKNKSFAAAAINFRNIKLACMITAIAMLALSIQDMVYVVLSFYEIHPGMSSEVVGIGNYLYLLVLFSAIFIPSLNFRKMMNLGGKRADFFKGCAINYLFLAAGASLAGIILYYTYDRFIVTYYHGVINLLEVFGWIDRGPVMAFLQQSAFLFLLAACVHTLTAIQGKWYGWLTDAIIVAVISVFTPIEPLRALLVRFFTLIIFHPNAILQVASCCVLAVGIYSINLFVLNRKNI